MPPITTIARSSPEKATETASAETRYVLEPSSAPATPVTTADRYKHRQLVAIDRVTLECRAQLVLADRHQHMPERRAHHPQEQIEPKNQSRPGHRKPNPHREKMGRSAPRLSRSSPSHRRSPRSSGTKRVGEGGQSQGQQRKINAAPPEMRCRQPSTGPRPHHRQQNRQPDLISEPVAVGSGRRHKRRCRTRCCGRRRRAPCNRRID